MNPKVYRLKVKSLTDNVFKLLEDDWMLVSAGNPSKHNMLTASWGAFGILWNKPIAIGFIRPQRYTIEFLEQSETFTLSFFTEKHRKALEYCGSHSGRTSDKTKDSGLTPLYTDKGSVYYAEARLIVECRKLYVDSIKPENFVIQDLVKNIYPKADFHKFFIGEIISCFTTDESFKNKSDAFLDEDATEI
jgi:flavin reductase (DIM6/NTAB) family NADH-FMN oxidoreductase RutF